MPGQRVFTALPFARSSFSSRTGNARPSFDGSMLLVRQGRRRRSPVEAIADPVPRAPLVGSCPAFRPVESRAFPFDGSLALPWHPSRNPDCPRLRPTAGAFRAATPPDRTGASRRLPVSGGQDASLRRVQQSIYVREPDRIARFPLPLDTGGKMRLTALFPLRLASPRNPWPSKPLPAFAVQRLSRARAVLHPFRRPPREAASRAPRHRPIRPLRGRVRFASDIPCRAGHQRSKPLRVPEPLARPETVGRRSFERGRNAQRQDKSAPSSRQGGRPWSVRVVFLPPYALAPDGFCNRERFTSSTANRNEPEVGRPEVSLVLLAPAARPLSRLHRPASFGPGGRSQRFAAPHPHRDMPSGITPTPKWPDAPVALP
jgi:hypothetical protein